MIEQPGAVANWFVAPLPGECASCGEEIIPGDEAAYVNGEPYPWCYDCASGA